jgi:hypothetical protein
MVEGVQRLQQMATRMHEMARKSSTMRITEGDPEDDEDVIVD